MTIESDISTCKYVTRVNLGSCRTPMASTRLEFRDGNHGSMMISQPKFACYHTCTELLNLKLHSNLFCTLGHLDMIPIVQLR